MLIRIRAEQAALGMYVQGFAGSWFAHPFWRAHFVIASNADLLRIREGGTDIFIDPAKGATVAPQQEPRPEKVAIIPRGRPSTDTTRPFAPAPTRPKPAPRRSVAPAAFGKADEARAAALAQRSTRVVKELFDDCRLGKSIQTPQILEVVQDIADTLERNITAFSSVTRLRAKDDYTYTHSVAVCALMICLAREAGLASQAVRDLGTAGLLHDVGKLQIDESVLRKADDLTEDERAQIVRHPELGHALLSQDPALPAAALDVCLHHHERLDGSGYPFGLKGESITVATRIAAICDVYDAMTSHRPYRRGMLPVDAITLMAEMDNQFDRDLLFRFMRSVGVFPAGKLIRLRSNRLAVVLPSAREDRCPLVRAFYDTIGTRFTEYEDVVLSDRLSDDQAVSQEDPADWFSEDWAEMSSRITAGSGRVKKPEVKTMAHAAGQG